MNDVRRSLLLFTCIAALAPIAVLPACEGDGDGAGGAGAEGGSGGSSSGAVVELGSFDLTTEDADNGVFYADATVSIPGSAKGANLILELPGSSGNLVMIDKMSRGDTVLRDYWTNPLLPQRGEPIEGVFTLQYPTSPEVQYATGEHTIRLASDTSTPGAKLYAIYKKDGSTSSGTLDFNVYLAGIEGVTADGAADHPQFKAMWDEVVRLFGKASISVGDVSFIDVGDETLFDLQGPSSAPGSDLARLFSTSGSHSGRRVNLFILRRLSQDTGNPLLGISGGVPGPGQMVGTVHSGLVANGEEMLNATDLTDKNIGPLLVAQIVVHETGHYLGLNHTSEKEWGDGTCPGGDNTHDPIADTPECGPAQDGSTGAAPNCSVGTGECATAGSDNLMFWAGVDYSKLPPEADAQVTSGQSFVMLRNPLTK